MVDSNEKVRTNTGWRAHLAYARYVFRHKLYVLRAGRKLGVGWLQLLAHDASKFFPSEWTSYARTFYNEDGTGVKNPEWNTLSVAWNSHQKRNAHHWQRFLITWDSGKTEPLAMPEMFVREMVADWIGAALAQGKTADSAVLWWEEH